MPSRPRPARLAPGSFARLAACLVLACASVRIAHAGLPATPVLQWEWRGRLRNPASPNPTSPVVAQLTDDNGDGRIDASDSPDVAFLSFDPATYRTVALNALHGDTGATIFQVATTLSRSNLAAGDLDGDGIVEFIGRDALGFLTFEHDGTPGPRYAVGSTPLGVAGVADVNQDGIPEIVFAGGVTGAAASPSWTVPQPRWVAYGSSGQGADLDEASAGLEVLVGGTLYSADGRVLWSVPELDWRATAIADLDADGDPEIVSCDHFQVFVLDHLGRAACPPLTLPPATITSPIPSQPTIADVDGDGDPEIVVSCDHVIHALRWTGSGLDVLWSTPSTNRTLGTAVAAFDFDGDGADELLVTTDFESVVLDGRDGSVEFTEPLASQTTEENPVVANLDADPEAEFLFPFDNGVEGRLRAYEVPLSRTPRPAWNQSTYHCNNVEDDGTIPRVEEKAWQTHRTWHAQLSSCRERCRADLVAPVGDTAICVGDVAVLDAGGLVFANCAGTIDYEWHDGAGPIGSSASIAVSPAGTTTYEVRASCSSSPACATIDRATVAVQHYPIFDSAAATDVDPCQPGIRLTWPAATFEGGPGQGRYNVYRSDDPVVPSCADALGRPAIAVGLDALSFLDLDAPPGRPVAYVVEAEDLSSPTTCLPGGPAVGGAVRRSCAGLLTDAGRGVLPAGVFAALRVSHAADEVTVDWSRARALEPSEHFHLLKTIRDPRSSFTRVNPERDLSRAFSEVDLSARLQFFDVRVADACEEESADEFPPGSDDRDRDRFANHLDVCPDVADPLQLDTDGDGVGDACDS